MIAALQTAVQVFTTYVSKAYNNYPYGYSGIANLSRLAASGPETHSPDGVRL
jgi:hypothetical protein